MSQDIDLLMKQFEKKYYNLRNRLNEEESSELYEIYSDYAKIVNYLRARENYYEESFNDLSQIHNKVSEKLVQLANDTFNDNKTQATPDVIEDLFSQVADIIQQNTYLEEKIEKLTSSQKSTVSRLGNQLSNLKKQLDGTSKSYGKKLRFQKDNLLNLQEFVRNIASISDYPNMQPEHKLKRIKNRIIEIEHIKCPYCNYRFFECICNND